jgi:sulfotransferase 6B1
MATFYLAHCSRTDLDLDVCVQSMTANVAPAKSHTFRSGQKAGWQKEFTDEHSRLFDRVAGDLLIELGYERDHSWAA